MQVIPTILVKTKKELEHKIKIVMRHVDTVQIDVMDGVFVPNTTWAKVDIIKRLKFPIEFEVHLMVKDPEATIESWADAGAKRIIFHIEATRVPEECIKIIKRFKREVGIAINPKTPISRIEKFLSKIDYVLVMGVDPGFSGQKFQPIILNKIKKTRKLAPNIKIGVDGGVNQKNAKEIVGAGADLLCTASAIFKKNNIRKAIEDLEKI